MVTMVNIIMYSKLDENALPPKEEFYSKVGLESISDEDYVHEQNVWKEFLL